MSHRRIRNTKGGRQPGTHGKEHFPTQRTDWPEDKDKGAKKEKPKITDITITGDRMFRPVFPGTSSGIPSHLGPRKKLHSKTGFNLAISMVDEDTFKVMGKMDHDADGDDVLELDSEEVGEVRILGLQSKHYVAMDQDGKVYAESDRDSEATIFIETLNNGWNSYASKLNAEKDWFLGIKKSGKAKRGHRTAQGQKATLFVPRPVDPS